MLVSRRRLGFAAPGRRELFVVLQSDVFSALETAVVAPLDDGGPLYAGDPLVVSVSGRDAGARADQVVLVTHMQSVRLDRFEPAQAGRIGERAMAAVGRPVEILLEVGAGRRA